MLSENDNRHLARAIELAALGRGQTSPNPLVGAVITKGGEVVGEGFHERYGADHAEVAAITNAGGPDKLQGATIYVSLEPCCHQGRTPPCTDAILQAGLARVVVASDDPSAKANGRGLGILRDEGIQVDLVDGQLRRQAELLNQPFRKISKVARPWVVAKYAGTLDGKIATATGDSKWISGEQSRRLVHEWRSDLDAVAVGIGTALADDPQLTARDVAVFQQPRRVVFDSKARLPISSKLVEAAAELPLTVVVGRGAERAQVDVLIASGVEVIVATGENEAARVASALDQLAAAGITSVLLEGGPKLAGAFLDAGEVDELRAFVSPILFGSKSARDPFEGAGSDTVAGAVRLPGLSVEPIGEDFLFRSRLREW